MQWSHSRVECFETCQFKYKMRYSDGLLTLPPENADNALILGTALHTGLEKGVSAAIAEYYAAYPIITDAHVDEAMKLEHMILKARKLLPDGGIFEKLISNSDFIGYTDYLVPVDSEFDLYDFKYSNNGSKYRQSPQLHIYKHFLEQKGIKIRNMFYLIVPKVKIKQGKKEDLARYRTRIQAELLKLEPILIPIQFDYTKVIDFMLGIKKAQETTEFTKNASYLCNWCEYQEYCEKGHDYMILPKNERRSISKVTKHVVWVYGAPFSGKTTFANCFPDPLMLNTDGNIKFVDAPVIPIRDEVTVEGRMTKRKLAWEIFKEAITELEKKSNDFKTVIVDLLEDFYEHCRLYMYREMGITHESDDSFRAWDKVTTEFLSTLKRLMNLDYENIILISHEDLSKDVTKKGGDKITAIKPNLREKVANKVAGMVDIVARVIAEGESHTLSFRTSEVIFGGGRLKVNKKEIPLEYVDFIAVYEDSNTNTDKPAATPTEKPQTGRRSAKMKNDTTVKETPPEPTQNSDTGEDETPIHDDSDYCAVINGNCENGKHCPEGCVMEKGTTESTSVATPEKETPADEPAKDSEPETPAEKEPPKVRTRKRRDS